jgi:hypothetical protein
MVLVSRDLRADCASEFEEAQRARNAGRLISAEEHAGACAAAACPAWLQTKCSAWREELRARVPTLAVRATDTAGKDIERATLTLDDQPIGDRVDGRSIRVDPGSHTLRLAGPCALEQRVVVAEGERDRVVTLACPPAPAPARRATAGADDGASSRARTPGTGIAIAIAGVGLAALGVGTYFGIRALGSASSMRDTCPGPPACYVDDPAWQRASTLRSDASTQATVADVALAVGVVAVAVGVYFLVRPAVGPPTTTAGRF